MSAVAPSPRLNNFLPTANIIQRMKYLIVFETLFGINRLYLCGYRRCTLWFSYVYVVILYLVALIVIFRGALFTRAHFFYKTLLSFEYILLGLGAMFIQKSKLRKFFSSLQTFDDNLNIGNAMKFLSPRSWYVYGVAAVVLYNFIEATLFYIFTYEIEGVVLIIYVIYLPTLVHDVEMVFFCYLLGSILVRLYVVKVHLAKVFSVNIESCSNEQFKKLDTFTKFENLNVSSVHRLYDLLHTCSEKLDGLMSLSMLVMIITSGSSMIMILKNALTLIQLTNAYHDDQLAKVIQSVVAVSMTRCVKYIAMLIFPCYISNKTKGEVAIMRTIIYDTLNTAQIEKMERRKIKAFFELVCHNEFAYSIFGVVNLDMSLPLSFVSLCVTYLIIVVQFSKFFD